MTQKDRKHRKKFWRTLEIYLINCEISLMLTWSKKCVIISNTDANQETIFAITVIKLYVSVVTLSTQDDRKLQQQLKSGFKRMINWNKYQLKIPTHVANRYLDYLNDPSFQGVNRRFVLSFENIEDEHYTQNILSTKEIKDYNVIIDGKNLLEHIQKIATGQGDDYTDYNYFENY